jgi:hypothetical protein
MMRHRLLSGVLRGGMAILAVGVAVLGVKQAIETRARHRDIQKLLAETGLGIRQPETARAAATDPDPVRARLAVARALLAEAFDYRSFEKLPPRDAAEAAARVNERLELAREIAAEALAARPGAWQAAMIVGGATYRLWSSRGDPRVFSGRSAWEEPLLAAARLAPGEAEPWRFLAVAWLEVWPTLTGAERHETLAVLSRAFQDPETFARCAELWLSAAPDRAQAFSLVPDDSRAWSLLEGLYAGRGDWDGFCAARLRRDGALVRELRQRIAETGERLRGGDRSGARSLAAGIVDSAPVELRFADAVEGAIAICPPGTVGSQETARRWLAWVADGSVRGHERLSAGAVARLAASAGALPPPEEALAALSAGDLVEAERLERRNAAPATEAWAPYWVAKSRVLARQRRAGDAALALARVQRDSRASVPGAEAHLAVNQAGGDAGRVAAARGELAALAATAWPATAWQWRSSVAHLDVLAGADAPGFVVGLDVVPALGAVVQVTLDGATELVAPVRTGATLSVASPVSRGAHLVEVQTLAGGRVVPGQVELTPGER